MKEAIASAEGNHTSTMSELTELTKRFVASVSENRIDIYNEFSLQHEFGIFLRAALPGYAVQFERNVEFFAQLLTTQ